MKPRHRLRPILAIACMAIAPTAFAWDPISLLQGAVQGRINNQLHRGVAELFRSVEIPDVGARPPGADIRGVRPGEFVLYGTPSCGYCKQARAHLQRRGIAYVDKDVSSDSQANAEFASLGGYGVPLFIIGSQRLSGFNVASFDAAYARFQAEQPSAPLVAQPQPADPASTLAVPVVAKTSAAFAAGDILKARIDRVKLLATADARAQAVGQLGKQEEVVYLGESQDRFLKDRSAAAEGWADQTLLASP
jgi:glutaredoxin